MAAYLGWLAHFLAYHFPFAGFVFFDCGKQGGALEKGQLVSLDRLRWGRRTKLPSSSANSA